MASNKKIVVPLSFDTVFKELERRVDIVSSLFQDDKLVKLTKYYVAILSACDNRYNCHFAENALTLLTFTAYEIDALTHGTLEFVGQEKIYKDFLSKQSGSFDKKSSNKESLIKLTECCVTYLHLEVASSDSDLINLIEVLDRKLNTWRVKLQDFGDDIVSALTRKNKGRGGFKFVFNVKHYGGFKFSSECAAETDAHGNKIPKVSDGVALVRTALDINKRDLYEELQSLFISPLKEFPHTDIITAVDLMVAEEEKRLQAEKLAYERKCIDREILAKKNADERKRKKALEAAAALAEKAAAEAVSVAIDTDSSSDSTVSAKAPKARKNNVNTIAKKNTKKVPPSSPSSSSASSSDDGSSLDTDGGFTLGAYKGGENDDTNVHRIDTGDLDVIGDGGYEDGDAKIVKLLRGCDVTTAKNFLLRAGQMTAEEVKRSRQSASSHRRSSANDRDGEWDDAKYPAPPSQLDGLKFDQCAGPEKIAKVLHLESNEIDLNASSEEDSVNSGVRAVPTRLKVGRGKGTKRRKVDKSKRKKEKRPLSRDSFSSEDETAVKLLSSEDSDVPKRKRKSPKSKNEIGAKPDDDAEEKPRKAREIVALSEQHVTQYSNLSLLPFQMTPAQRQSARQEKFEVDGKMMSEDEIKSMILNDVELVSKNLDSKFISFLRQHIMVDVFKDVHFISNVIQFYRMKRFLHKTQDGDHIICHWQVVLKEVASDIINELMASNEKIIEQMDKNLLDLKEMRRDQRHDNSLVIGSEEERLKYEEDLNDLLEYKEQMKLSRKALEEIEKVMKRRINAFAHTTAAKIICIWAKLNGFQHLLRGNMSRFEKKFLMDASMPFYSVLSDDLSRRWGNVVTSPNGLFPGIDLAGRNDTSLIGHSAESNEECRVVEMDIESEALRVVEKEVEEEVLMENSLPLHSSSVRGIENRERIRRDYLEFAASEAENESVLSPPLRAAGLSRSKSTTPPITSESVGRHEFNGDTRRVRFPPPDADSSMTTQSELVGLPTADEEETQRQNDLEPNGDQVESSESSFASPINGVSLKNLTRFSSDEVANESPPVRPSKAGVYTSALLNGSPCESLQTGSPVERNSEFSPQFDSNGSKRMENMSTPSNFPSIKLPSLSAPMSVVGESYLSSISSGSSSVSACSPTDLCASNAAVLFDELKRMGQDARSVDGMKRFIEVMNEKPPTTIMPATKAEEDKILNKAKAKKKKEEAKLAAASEVAKQTAALVADAASSSAVNLAEFSSHDEELSGSSAATRQKTDSYVLFQKVFMFICQSRIEVRDDLMNMQFFGQRMLRTLDNSVVLKFLLFLLRNKNVPIEHLVVYLMDEKILFSQLKCSFGIAYKAEDYFNILGDGYCVLRSMYAMFCNQNNSYRSKVADMKAADKALFKSMKSRREFFSFLNLVRESIGTHYSDEVSKTSDKKKLKTLMTLFATFPQLKQVPGAYWACLDWVAYAEFNCTAFSTNYPDCVTGYAQLHCSSAIRRDISSATIGLAPYSLDEVYRVLSEPVTPSFCVLEGQHAFIVQSPAKEDAIKSFKSVLGMFLGSCQDKVAILCEHFASEIPIIETILEKMIADNFYALNESEAKLMSAIVKNIEGATEPPAFASQDHVILCSDKSVASIITIEEFEGVRDTSSEVVDLCDSDTGDVDRVKVRATKARTARHEQELLELKFKFQDSERENKFLLRLIAKDSKLFHDPPIDILPEVVAADK